MSRLGKYKLDWVSNDLKKITVGVVFWYDVIVLFLKVYILKITLKYLWMK